MKRQRCPCRVVRHLRQVLGCPVFAVDVVPQRLVSGRAPGLIGLVFVSVRQAGCGVIALHNDSVR